VIVNGGTMSIQNNSSAPTDAALIINDRERQEHSTQREGNLSTGQVVVTVSQNQQEDIHKKVENTKQNIAKEDKKPNYETVDPNKLLRGKIGSRKVTDSDLQYYITQAIYRDVIERAKEGSLSKEDQLILNNLMLLQYSKAAPVRTSPANPFAIFEGPYHRSESNSLLEGIEKSMAKELNIDTSRYYGQNLFLINGDSLNFKDVIERNYGPSQIFKTLEEIDSFISSGLPPQKVIDITLLNLNGNELFALNKKLKKAYKNLDPPPMIISFITHLDEKLLYVASNENEKINKLRSANGFVPSKEDIYKFWLKIASFDEIFDSFKVAQAEFASSSGSKPAEMYKNYKDFIAGENLIFSKLLSPTKSELSNNQKIIVNSLIDMLKGFENPSADISNQFKDRGMEDLLQFSYFRINNAFREAIFQRNDSIKFQKALDVVNQEIQMILAIIKPYQPEDLEKIIVPRLQSSEGIITNPDFQVNVYAQPSAMRCLSTLFSSIQKQKGSHHLNTLILKDSYYETVEMLQSGKEIKDPILDGDRFNKDPEGCINELEGNIDVFLCEFHHNISLEKTCYQAENILGQVKSLFANDKVAIPLHLIIDSTINLEASDDFKIFFNDPEIKQLIADGKLNVAMVRSAQKFDMLGFDNYYGGIAVTVNNGSDFGAFNNRMGHREDQLQGINYQGLCHLQQHAWQEIEAYRQTIMNNTNDLYQMLPPSMIASEENQSVIQISELQDKKSFFLDIKFNKKFPLMAQDFETHFRAYCKANQLPLTFRASFGFANSNLTSSMGTKGNSID